MADRMRPKKPFDSVRYGANHKMLRRELAAVVAAGRAVCARCGEPIEPGTKWHLDHRDDGNGYLGPSHEACNARAGLETMIDNAVARKNGSGRPEPFRWSRRSFDDPPVGTELLGVERHVGGGVWEPVEAG